ncbi:hypothetical protein K501DRAFT_255104 [Backusella circina FSU 941]|nr:hypothetical protein K501DRAFT_255104 [Backusella circina FSU 941]
MTTLSSFAETNIHHDKIDTSITEKTQEQPSGIITPPLSPINGSLASSQPTRQSLRISTGQTGLPWLARDADGDTFSSQNNNSASSRDSAHVLTSPPPKFIAHPRTSSIVRFPTRKRKMQKHIYSMNDGLDPVKVLCKRLLCWRSCVKYLISMFHRVRKVESTTGRNYRKLDAKFSMPAIENQFKASNGVQDAWAAFRQYTRENSLIHEDFVDFIENETISVLKTMIKDINHMSQSLKKNKNLYTSELFDDRKYADKIITQLNKNIYNTTNMINTSKDKGQGEYVIAKKDPLLTKYVVVNKIRDLYKQENELHKSFLEAQDKYKQFEQSKIIDVYTALFQRFEEYRTQHNLERLESVDKVVRIFNEIEADSEWSDFLQRHENELVKLNSSFKDEINLDFPNQDHILVQPVINGILQRRSSKKWIEDYYILSPVGLLHRFKSEDTFLNNPLKPDLTLFIPQSTLLVNPTNNLLELRGKTLSLFGGKKHFELSSPDPSALHHWITALNRMALQQETVDTTPTNEPMEQRSHHSKVEAEESNSIAADKTLDEPEQSQQPIVEPENENKQEESSDSETVTRTPDANQDDALQEHENISKHKDIVTPVSSNKENNHSATNVKVDPPNGPTREGSDLFWDPRVDINFDK